MKDVDELIEETSVDQILNHYGKPLSKAGSAEHRMECVFNEECADNQYGNLTVKLNDAVNRIYCHSCGVRGNLLTLLHGLERHEPPTGGRLRGDEFKSAVAKLREISGATDTVPQVGTTTVRPTQSPAPKPVNTPLVRHEKEAAQKIADLYNDLVTDVADMSPKAAEYVRHRRWMTPELLEKWGVGWIPGNGRSLFRKGYLVYTHRNERSEVVSYSGRDLSFEEKWAKWIREGRPDGKRPGKHRFVQGFHKGLELYGGHAGRLEEPYVRESLAKRGLVVAEGMNEVLRMETLGVAAVGLGSNKATDAQVEKLIRFARQAGHDRIVLMPDCDEEGEAAFKELLWQLSEASIDVKLGCSSNMHEGKFAGRQPEDFTDDEWNEIDLTIQR
ncbi:toprim domain-containing protein [Thalassoglobus neptunius]|nr:toprim domain-containing protein [Thalassoglobus neptunius]